MSDTVHQHNKRGPGSRRPNPADGAVALSLGDRPGRSSAWVLVIGLGGLLFAGGAVVLEVVSSGAANSPVPGWAEWVPLAWPPALRVTWWLAVAAAAAGFRWSLGRLGLQPSRVVTVLTVGPFVVFAAGIAVGASWATWH